MVTWCSPKKARYITANIKQYLVITAIEKDIVPIAKDIITITIDIVTIAKDIVTITMDIVTIAKDIVTITSAEMLKFRLFLLK